MATASRPSALAPAAGGRGEEAPKQAQRGKRGRSDEDTLDRCIDGHMGRAFPCRPRVQILCEELRDSRASACKKLHLSIVCIKFHKKSIAVD
ncbi:hypothetical protein OsJ_22383 [Oryza sativa Japonica Group]|uniref:Uncharacterized protein n=1 Tax=Oryza sativa subsp. japonica TaxID=39947 RepID=A3BEQ0_ORYSJ|nr:hypothetical protein OsJ_22383 [Oryza sativa Japonica Group]